jgi:hypothetical protein
MTRSFGPSTMTSTQGSPLLQALADHKVTASVVDLDHYRIQGGLAVETDYIILVESTCIGETSSGETFEPFRYVHSLYCLLVNEPPTHYSHILSEFLQT